MATAIKTVLKDSSRLLCYNNSSATSVFKIAMNGTTDLTQFSLTRALTQRYYIAGRRSISFRRSSDLCFQLCKIRTSNLNFCRLLRSARNISQVVLPSTFLSSWTTKFQLPSCFKSFCFSEFGCSIFLILSVGNFTTNPATVFFYLKEQRKGKPQDCNTRFVAAVNIKRIIGLRERERKTAQNI